MFLKNQTRHGLGAVLRVETLSHCHRRSNAPWQCYIKTPIKEENVTTTKSLLLQNAYIWSPLAPCTVDRLAAASATIISKGETDWVTTLSPSSSSMQWLTSQHNLGSAPTIPRHHLCCRWIHVHAWWPGPPFLRCIPPKRRGLPPKPMPHPTCTNQQPRCVRP